MTAKLRRLRNVERTVAEIAEREERVSLRYRWREDLSEACERQGIAPAEVWRASSEPLTYEQWAQDVRDNYQGPEYDPALFPRLAASDFPGMHMRDETLPLTLGDKP